MEYFLAQRIKPKEIDDDGYSQYVDLTTSCQKIIYTAMKTKQTVQQLTKKERPILPQYLPIFSQKMAKLETGQFMFFKNTVIYTIVAFQTVALN